MARAPSPAKCLLVYAGAPSATGSIFRSRFGGRSEDSPLGLPTQSPAAGESGSPHMKAESEKPQNSQYHKDRPQHVDSPYVPIRNYSCGTSFRASGMPLSDFPHSIHSRLERGVISPQNGHILCDPYSLLGIFNPASSSVNRRATEATRLSTRSRKRRKSESIHPPPLFLPWIGGCCQ